MYVPPLSRLFANVDVGGASHRDACIYAVGGRLETGRSCCALMTLLDTPLPPGICNPSMCGSLGEFFGNKVVQIVVLDQTTIRLQPDAIFDTADIAALHYGIVGFNIDAVHSGKWQRRRL